MSETITITRPYKEVDQTQVAVSKRASMLNKAEQELKTKKEMLADVLRNDEEIVALEEKLKDARQRFTSQKQATLNEPEARKIVSDIKELQQEVKDTKKLLGDELLAYFIQNNTLEYVTENGTKARFSVGAKFSKKDQLSLF